MKRRRFCQSIALGSAGWVGTMGSQTWAEPADRLSRFRWVILYWMPYDNDLVRFGEPIVAMLTEGSRTFGGAIALQSDYFGDARMRRRTIIRGEIREIPISGADSSDSSAFAAYLDWALQTYEAEHWAMIVMGHGGRINEISPDDHGNPETRRWMSVDQFTHIVADFNQRTQGRVELLFLQNCNKATLEVIYEARHSARYTLASQLTLGAPNYYYAGFLEQLDGIVNGRDGAIAIINSERADMYRTLTLVDNQTVGCIPEHLTPLIQMILDTSLQFFSELMVPSVRYFGEQHCDLLTLLIALTQATHTGAEALAKFSEFLQSCVITDHRTDGQLARSPRARGANSAALCGLGLYLPETAEAVTRYRDMALYQAVDWMAVYRRMFAA